LIHGAGRLFNKGKFMSNKKNVISSVPRSIVKTMQLYCARHDVRVIDEDHTSRDLNVSHVGESPDRNIV